MSQLHRLQAHRDDSENVYFVQTLDAAAELAVELAALEADESSGSDGSRIWRQGSVILRGLFSGGTLAYEAQLILREYVPAVYANAPLDKRLNAGESHR